MIRTPFLLKSIDDGLESLDIEVALDHLRSVVTLHMLEFDADHEQPVIEKILTHLGLQARAPPRAPARGSRLQAA